jgi:hypothetical protein
MGDTFQKVQASEKMHFRAGPGMRLHHEEVSLALPRIEIHLSTIHPSRKLDFYKELAE